MPVHLPALRERREDIPLLLDYFVDKICRADETPVKRISPEAVSYLMELDWPGNVRQLEHAVQVAVAMSDDRQMLYPGDFPVRRAASLHRSGALDQPLVRVPEEGLDFDEVVTSFERSLLNQALTVSGGNKARAADLLRIKRTTLLSKMKTFDERGGVDTPRKPMGKALSATALVVEKDGAVRKFIARTLMTEGYRVLEAAASSGALELFNCWRNDISVVVTGAEVPGMAGDELLRRMRRALPSLAAVVVADHTFGVPEPERQQTEVVPRPFTPEDLMAAVSSLIGGRLERMRVACA